MKRASKIILVISICLDLLILLSGIFGWYVLSRYIPKREAIRLVSAISEGNPDSLRGWPLIDEDDINWLRKARATEWSIKDIKFFSDTPGPRRYLPKRAMATFVLTGYVGEQGRSEQREAIIYLTRYRFRWTFSLAIIR